MLPVGDFNFVVGGIATFAASVGYAFTRRRIPNSRNTTENAPDQSESTVNLPANIHHSADSSVAHEEPAISVETSQPTSAMNVIEDIQTSTPSLPVSVQSRRSSLKRKRPVDDTDEVPPDAGYPHNLASIYPPPKKRSRTPSADEKNEPEGSEREAGRSCPTPVVDDAVENTPPVAGPEPDCFTRVSLPSPPRTPKSSPRKASEPLPTTPVPVFGTPVAMPSPPRTPLPSRAATMNAFSAFSGTASPFASFSASSPSMASKPIWTSKENTASGSSIVAQNQVSTSDDDNFASTATRSPENGHVLEAVSASKSTVEYITGEEDEDVELELKGVKLFVKRGHQPFSDGVVGQVKLLSSKATLDERLLFRREPLWKVSMNVRMHPTVRCTYEAEENVVRLILQELVEQPNVAQEDRKKEIVVYALKPGRSCSKKDFKDFAISLVACPGLKPR